MKKVITSALPVVLMLMMLTALHGQITRDPGHIISLYNKGLRHDNAGIVESTIFNVMQARAHYPEQYYGKTIDRLKELVLNGTTATIRYKAFIALNYFDHQNWQKAVLNKTQDESDRVFTELAEKLDREVLSFNVTETF